MKRSEIDKKYKWELGHMLESDEVWYEQFEALKGRISELEGFKGKLGQRESLLSLLKLIDELGETVELLFVYAYCKHDEDTKEDKYNVMYGNIYSAYVEFNSLMSFAEPELTALDESILRGFASDPDFKDYDYFLNIILKNKPHILSEKEERLLAMAGDFAGGFNEVFKMIDNADLDNPEIDIDGKKVRMTHGAYSATLQHRDQDVRRAAFEAYYGAYQKHINSLAVNYASEVKKNVFFARVKNYPSYLDKALKNEDVPKKVYETLVRSVSENIKPVHEYVEFRKKALGLKDYYMYDMYVPVFEGASFTLKYDEACETVANALEILGADYVSCIRDSFKDGWIDVMETEGKRSGGYCISAYLAPHPYILLNYAETTHDIFTLAHELGHAMHSKYSAECQPPSKANYQIFVAEVASTVNEMLLLDYLLKTVKDENVKKYLHSYKLDTFRTTIFRQTMFSEFELKVHTMAEKGEQLSLKALSDCYDELNTRYYGSAVTHDDWIQYEWARIPHFYRAFYVYKYATGLVTAINIADRIIKGEKGMLEKYRAFLSAGGSKSPYEIIKDTGIDLATDEPYKTAMASFKETLDKLKSL